MRFHFVMLITVLEQLYLQASESIKPLSVLYSELTLSGLGVRGGGYF